VEEHFRQIERRGGIRPGVIESILNREIFLLANEVFGTTPQWLSELFERVKIRCCPMREPLRKKPPVKLDDLLRSGAWSNLRY
jgi:hypothetical protein